jgi:hypothetical protein
MGDPADAFGLFVSSVEGHPVTRFGSSVLLGADRDPDNPKKILYRTDAVIAIPQHEAVRYAREYNRLISEGALVERTADDWRGQQTAAQTDPQAPAKAQKGNG